MDQENIMLYKNKDKSCTMTDLYLNHNISFGYEDSYNYYDIHVDIILFVKRDNEYISRYDVNKNKIVPLQLKINNFYLGELHMLPNDITIILIYRDKYKNDLVFVLHSVFNDYFQASLVQYRY